METVTVRMARGDRGTSWGFGVTEAPNRDVIIVNVVGGSLADRAGLRDGDIIDRLEGLGNLDINAVDRLLVTSRDKIELVVHRSPSGGQTRVWRPEITEQRHIEDRPYRVSLEHNSDTRAPQGFNAAALPFNTDPRVKHLQYNSPMNLYSNESAAEQYVQQTAGIIDNGVPGSVPRQSNEPAYQRSETLRLIKEEEGKPRGNLSDHPNPQGLPVCFICNRPILGVMARAAGHDLHGDCLSCATCGTSLRNVGHHFIEDRFYCDVHGRQKKGQGTPMDPALAVKTSPRSGNPERMVDGGRSFYQPEVMSRRPLSVSPTLQHTSTHIHYGTPKTHGPLSPSLRGVPSSVNYGTNQQHTGATSNSAVTARPIQVQHNPHPQYSPNPPPIPSNPPPDSRVPASVRSAVSPRRATKSPRQWPPEHGLPTLRYWQIDPASQARKEKENEPLSLHDLVEATDREKENNPKRGRARKAIPPSAQVVFSKVFRHNSEQQEASVTVENAVTHAVASSTLLSTKPTITNGIRWTVIHAPSSPELRAQFPRNETPTIERPQNLTQSSEVAAAHPNSDDLLEAAPQETNHTLHVQVTTDSSTSPIPTIELPRRRSGTADHSGIIKALSPAPFKRTSPPIPPTTPPLQEPFHPLEVDTLLPDHQYRSLVGVNTTPRPYSSQSYSPSPVPTVEEKPKRAKALKKVDFSKATVIPEIWQNTNDVIDEEEEIQCDLSPTSSLPFTPPADKEDKESSSMDTATPYDGDESETYDNKSDNASTIEIEDEQEQWMREEIELAQKEELARLGSPMEIRTIPDHKEVWRQQAMALLNDDTQMERDIAIVAALNDRLQGIKHMEEEDRQRAIACIERHQSNLEEAQDQLSALLDSAIAFLRKLDTSSSAASRASHREEVSPAPSPLKVYNVRDVLKGSEATSGRFKGPGDFIAERLDRICATNGQSYTRSSYEQHTEQSTTTGGGGGGAPAGKLVESRGHGSLNNPGGRIPYCESCKQQIRGAFVLATGLAWCPEHFVCAYRGCGRRLLECGFVEESGSKYCEGCFEAHIAPRCAKCAKPIISDCLNAMQKKWHPTCFTCAHCHKPFGNTAFYLENGLAYCENDWNALFTTKCVSCKYPIEAGDRWVEALGNAFHSNCFNCTRCHSNLEGESFFAKNGQPYCKMHA